MNAMHAVSSACGAFIAMPVGSGGNVIDVTSGGTTKYQLYGAPACDHVTRSTVPFCGPVPTGNHAAICAGPLTVVLFVIQGGSAGTASEYAVVVPGAES